MNPQDLAQQIEDVEKELSALKARRLVYIKRQIENGGTIEDVSKYWGMTAFNVYQTLWNYVKTGEAGIEFPSQIDFRR